MNFPITKITRRGDGTFCRHVSYDIIYEGDTTEGYQCRMCDLCWEKKVGMDELKKGKLYRYILCAVAKQGYCDLVCAFCPFYKNGNHIHEHCTAMHLYMSSVNIAYIDNRLYQENVNKLIAKKKLKELL